MNTSVRAGKLKWIARLHFWVMFFSFFLYLGLGFSLGPEFLYQDIRQKFSAFAANTVVVTAVVPGPPATPSVTATPTCTGLSAQIALDWANDTGTTTWDIERDSLPLTTGLVASQYTDTAVVANTTYSYVVTATGPMFPGVATSATVTATTLDCASIVPVTVTIETLGGKNARPDNRQNTDLSKRRPKVTGTSNTPYAIIDIVLTNPTLRARTTANANGYFEWIPPIAIDTGYHTLTVTATDPADSSRVGTDSFRFWTKNVSQKDQGDGDSRTGAAPATPTQPGTFDYTVTVLNSDKTVFQEENISAAITAKSGTFPAGARGQTYLNDASRRDVLQLSDDTALGGTTGTTVTAPLPLYLIPGQYRVRADVLIGSERVSREDTFILKGLPLFTLGGNEITYTQVASYVGTFFFLLLFLFLFLLLLFVREYWLYLHRLRNITESQLARFGFLGQRKGVIR